MGDPARPLNPALDAAVALRRDLHLARVRLVQRFAPGQPCDPRDAAEVRRLEACWEELTDDERRAASVAFRATHFCYLLARCPLGPRPWRDA